MHIVHGTWVPRDTDEFVQDGAFYLWVETDRPTHPRRQLGEGRPHPYHLFGEELETFLAERVGIDTDYAVPFRRWFSNQMHMLPSHHGVPLPSPEMLPYLDAERPAEWEFESWRLTCYRLRADVIAGLRDIHFAALYAADDFQLGSDLLFWYDFTQTLKAILAADLWIPTLKYRSLQAGDRPHDYPFELYGSWEILSEEYDTAVERYAACMPQVCTALSERAEDGTFYAPVPLLRHFSEQVVSHVASAGLANDKFARQTRDSLLEYCRSTKPIPGSERALSLYSQWAAWRDGLHTARRGAGFALCFRLQEPTPDRPDEWRLDFLLSAPHDPSFKVSLADFWMLTAAERQARFPAAGNDLDRQVLLALGRAARMYAAVWDGLETERPSGISLSLEEAHAFLTENAWVLEGAGYVVMVPAWYTAQGRRRARLRLKASTQSSTTASARSYFSLDSVIDYQYQLSIGGETVSEAEWESLVAAKTPLVQFRGQWMELDRDRMEEVLAGWQERRRTQPQMSLLELMQAAAEDTDDLEWEYDEVLEGALAALRSKHTAEEWHDPANFRGELREYQRQGVAWLRFLERLGLNPCLADDMGLGKTVQVIAQLVAERNDNGQVPPTLLIAPTSVLGNWRKELERFAPHLRAVVHQGAGRIKDARAFAVAAGESDVIITSYALTRLDEKLLRAVQWRRVVVDEAQNIKNPKSAQTRAIARLPATRRLALTGTPVENRLRDLWSIFNFLNPGYLGKEAQFRRAFEVPIQRDNDQARAATLKRLVDPFILRRLKTDRRIINDLPEKIEQRVYCNLTTEQASLYEVLVQDVERQLADAEGMQRRGLILSTLLRLKQICNHPAQFLHDGSAFTPSRSHKLQRLGEMVEEVMDSGESLLIFTQFTEIGRELERYLIRTLHRPAFYLHGGTAAARREDMVTAFQDPDAPPTAFVLSVRAGGTGLTLTKASHVFHFDRWWNPAVEDQATDRAFRIGQSKNVFAHKFVTLGTVEERIDAMIEDKKRLAGSITGSDESWLTEMDNASFSDLIALRRSAIVE